MNKGIISYNNNEYYGLFIEIKGMEWGLKTYQEIKRIENNINEILYNFDNSTFQIIKINELLDTESVNDIVFEKYKNEKDPLKRELLSGRINQLDEIKMQHFLIPKYYLVVYDSNYSVLEEIREKTNHLFEIVNIKTYIPSDIEIAMLLKASNTSVYNIYDKELLEKGKLDIDTYLSIDSIEFKPHYAVVDGIETYTVSIFGFPQVVKSGWGIDLFNRYNAKVVMSFEKETDKKIINQINKQYRDVNIKRASGKIGKLEEEVEDNNVLEDSYNQMEEIKNGLTSIYKTITTITFYNLENKKTKTFLKESRKFLKSQGFKFNVGYTNQEKFYIQSNIVKKNILESDKIFTFRMSSRIIASLLPFVFTKYLDEEGVMLGKSEYGLPIVLDIFKWDKPKYNEDGKFTNANGFIIGKSGGGKSYFIKNLMSLLYSENTRMYIFDPENEYKKISDNLGGLFIEVSKGGINPFHIYPILTENGERASSEETFNAHLLFLESFLTLVLKDITPNEKELLNNLIVETYFRKNIDKYTDYDKLKPTDFPRFEDLYSLILEKLNIVIPNTQEFERYTLLEIYINKFVGQGRYSGIWNCYSTLKANNDFVVFNFQSLFASKNNVVVNAQTLLILRFLENEIINNRNYNMSLGEDKEKYLKTMIFIDEGHMYIDPKTPIALDFIAEWYKRIRKYYGSINFATQSLNDLFANKDLAFKTKAIVVNSQYSYIFGLKQNEYDNIQYLFNNTINEVEWLSMVNARKGQCFIALNELQRMQFQVVATDISKKLFENINALEQKEEIGRFEKLEKENEE